MQSRKKEEEKIRLWKFFSSSKKKVMIWTFLKVKKLYAVDAATDDEHNEENEDEGEKD